MPAIAVCLNNVCKLFECDYIKNRNLNSDFGKRTVFTHCKSRRFQVRRKQTAFSGNCIRLVNQKLLAVLNYVIKNGYVEYTLKQLNAEKI